jgi:hypothetical protein
MPDAPFDESKDITPIESPGWMPLRYSIKNAEKNPAQGRCHAPGLSLPRDCATRQ